MHAVTACANSILMACTCTKFPKHAATYRSSGSDQDMRYLSASDYICIHAYRVESLFGFGFGFNYCVRQQYS